MAETRSAGRGGPGGWGRSPRTRRPGFTLVEILVAIAVVAILTGALVPAVGRARETAQSAAAMANVRQLVAGQSAYAARSEGWLAGVNTSGALGLIDLGASFLGDTSPTTPTTTHDWISPTLGDELRLPRNRAARTWAIFDRLACPRATERVTRLWGRSLDLSDFEAAQAARPATQLSYLAPSTFHYSPGADAWTPRSLRRAGTPPKVGWNLPYALPDTWRPRLSRVSRPDGKVAVADGTRYLTARQARTGAVVELDFDVTADPRLYSSFTSSGPTFESSRAYGRSYLPAGLPDYNVGLSMRFFDRELHAGYFDGHAGRMAGDEAWGDPTPWYPRGSRFVGGDATPEVLDAVGSTEGRFRRID